MFVSRRVLSAALKGQRSRVRDSIDTERTPRYVHGGTTTGLKGATCAARALARTGVEIMTDGVTTRRARADFERRTQGRPYTSPLPPDSKPTAGST